MEILNFIIPFIVLLTIVVFVHEYDHYYFARKYGVGVTDFSIGFGRELFGINDKNGTRWKFCLIPLGGYVKFFGDRNVFSQAEQAELLKRYNESDRKKLFVVKPLYQRSLIVFGGPLANFILAIFIFTFIYMFSGKDFTPAKISEVQENSPAFSSGLKVNDVITEINDNKISSVLEVSTHINATTKENVEIKHSSDISPDQNLYKLLKNSLEKDLRFQYTTKGIHKDDLNLNLDNFPIKKYGSQGQQKTFLIAMKLAQFDYLSKLDSKPILLLDDIFDKLDDSRVKQIINLVNQEKFNQIFISDTNKTRSENIIKKVNKSYKIFEI